MKQAIRERLGRFLAIRARSEQEVKQYLRHKAVQYELTESDMEVLLSRYKELGFIDDAKFSESRIHSDLGKGRGTQYIRARLHAAGVSRELMHDALARIDTQDVKGAMSKRLAKFTKKWEGMSAIEKRQRAKSLLFTSGFSGASIAAFIDDWMQKE